MVKLMDNLDSTREDPDMQRPVAQLFGLIVALGIGVTPYACRHLNDESSAEKIVRGQVVDPADPVASYTVSIMDPDPAIGQYCTGVVLAKDIILSAAHCFNDKTRRSYILFSPAYNAKLSNKQQPLFKIRRLAIHAQYSQDKGELYDKKILTADRVEQLVSPGKPLYDLALAYLDEKIPDSYEPAPLAGGSIDLTNGLITTAGYGCTTTNCKGRSNILKKVPMRYVKTYTDASMVVLLAGSKHGSCTGDSGGPDFINQNGALRVFALVSTGPESCEAGLSVDTLIEPYRGWIEQAMSGVRSGRKASIYTLTEY